MSAATGLGHPPLALTRSSQASDGPRPIATIIGGLYGAVGLAGVLLGAARGRTNVYRLPGREALWTLLASPLAGVVVGLGVVFLTRLAVHRYAWARRLHMDFRGLLGHLSAKDVLILAAASAIGEELLFRGALLPWLGLPLSTLVFGLLHIGPGLRFLPWTVSALVAGLLFGGLFMLFGDLGAPIAAHFTINYVNLGYIARTELTVD